MPPDTLGVLEDIRDAAQYVVDDTAGMTFDEFARDRRTRQLVERTVEIIGEAVNRMRRHAPLIAAQITAHGTIVAFHHAPIHGCDTIDDQAVWRAVQGRVVTWQRGPGTSGRWCGDRWWDESGEPSIREK